ncbi:hypothetical protein CVT25_010055 [Psilocybe cyanescens]|uniref:Flavin reductase like domain-containing protein n=1 Tax=Psilocybe cyanescens TaxID=93625 RepID=A0A409X3F5_PSICY|nr:hypothetical protein CVT25_010055 [Psilocybe cyanescens]
MSHAGLSLNICRRASLFSLLSKPRTRSLTLGAAARYEIYPGSGAPQRRRYATSESKTALKEVTVEQDANVVYQVEKRDSKKLKSDVRALLRDIAQPVAVVTSIFPPSKSSSYSEDNERDDDSSTTNSRDLMKPTVYHGATLSSFTSIAMDPYPLVAFALRIPSRMATALTSIASSDESGTQAHMVINLLSASQASTAVKFSRPDLYPTPFSGNSSSSGVPYTLSEDRLPVIDGAVGAISCRLVGKPLPLFDLDYLELGTETGTGMRPDQAMMPPLQKGEVASELFIARVLRVETVRCESEGEEVEVEVEDDSDCERPLPLVYHRRSYTSCHPKP